MIFVVVDGACLVWDDWVVGVKFIVTRVWDLGTSEVVEVVVVVVG